MKQLEKSDRDQFKMALIGTQPKVQTEYSIVFLCYNIRRVMSIKVLKDLNMALKRAFYSFLIPGSVRVDYIEEQKNHPRCHGRSQEITIFERWLFRRLP